MFPKLKRSESKMRELLPSVTAEVSVEESFILWLLLHSSRCEPRHWENTVHFSIFKKGRASQKTGFREAKGHIDIESLSTQTRMQIQPCPGPAIWLSIVTSLAGLQAPLSKHKGEPPWALHVPTALSWRSVLETRSGCRCYGIMGSPCISFSIFIFE